MLYLKDMAGDSMTSGQSHSGLGLDDMSNLCNSIVEG